MLHLKGGVMLSPTARGVWRDIEARLRPYVARRAPAGEVDDLVQDILVRIHRGLEGLEDGERFGAWVYRIAAHVITDAGRRRGAVASREAHRFEPAAGAEPAVGDEHDRDLDLGLDACVALFVARLPSPYREAITLTDLQGLTQKEAAELAGVSLSGMKSRVQRGREAIRQMFEQCCEISLDGRGRVVECEPRVATAIPPDCRDAAAAWASHDHAGDPGGGAH
jgi:RNA polymerase sigma-70 factor (ECF subfamily)